MMKKYLFLLSFMLLVGLTACSSKPSNEDLTNSFEKSLSGFKKVGVDLLDYMEVTGFTVADSYEEEPFYILKAQAHIHMKKSIDNQEIIAIENKAGYSSQYIIVMIRMFEIIKDYNQGVIDEKKKQSLFTIATKFPEAEGTLKAGDEFKTDIATYKFRKTDNGWMSVE